MSLKTFKHLHESQASDDAEKLGLKHLGRGVYGKNGDATHKTVDGKLVKLDSPVKQEPKQDTEKKPEPEKPSAEKPTSTSKPGMLADRDDEMSDGAIKQKGLDIGYNETDGFKPAPGNAGSMMQEIMSGEVSNIIQQKPDITDDELQMALYNMVKDTTLGKQNMGGEVAKTDRGAVPQGFDKKLWTLMASTARSGKQKHKKMARSLKELADSDLINPPAKIRNFYGHEESIKKQIDLISSQDGPFYTNKGNEIPKDVLIDLIKNSGGGENPSDTSTIAVDANGRAVVTFHSDKISTADIQANSTPNKESELMKGFVDRTQLPEVIKNRAKDIISEGQAALEEKEKEFNDATAPVAKKLSKVDLDSVIDKIKADDSGLIKSYFVGGKKSVLVSPKTGKVNKVLTKYLPDQEEEYSEAQLMKAFIDFMGDSKREAKPNANMIKFIDRVGKQNGIKADFSTIRKESLDVQRNTHAKLNETTIKLPDGTKKGLGDYLEGQNIIDKLHLGVVDGKEGEGVGKYPGLFNLNMGGVVVEAEQIKSALNIDSTDDFITHFDVGKPGDGEEVTKNTKTGAITGRNIFVYAITKKGERIPIAYKTQRSKQGATGKLSTTYQWHPEVQKKFKETNIVEKRIIREAKEGQNLVFFDIDETVFNTFAKIIVRDKESGKEVVQLTNSEFNSYKLKDNEEYDFSQFGDAKLFKSTSKVIKSVMNKVKQEFKDKRNIIVFLTARADFDSNSMFKDAFREQGLRVNDKRIMFELAGNLKFGTIPEKKKYIIAKKIKRHNPVSIKIYDDHRDNLDIAHDLAKKNPTIRFEKYLVKNGTIVNRGVVNETKGFTEHMEEQDELKELFGAIPFSIDMLKWQSKHKGQKPKGRDKWVFDYLIPVRDGGMLFVDDGVYSFTGRFKDAVKNLVKYLKQRASGKANLKQAKVTLKP